MKRPSITDRQAARTRPSGVAVMHQRWSGLLFLHWRVPQEWLTPLLPPGLHLDLHEGEAWLGIVPFFMDRIRPSLLPPVPGLSWFRELNVRTYVHDDHGTPGVWFFSLDCDQPLAVEIARRGFHLPYQHAHMHIRRDEFGIDYQCTREGHAPARFCYDEPRNSREAPLGSLEWFLVERYVLFSSHPSGTLCEGRVHHRPYRIAPATCSAWSTAPLAWNGMPSPSHPPDSLLVADPVEVEVFALKSLGKR